MCGGGRVIFGMAWWPVCMGTGTAANGAANGTISMGLDAFSALTGRAVGGNWRAIVEMTVDDVMVDDGRFVVICCVGGARDWIDVEQRHRLDVVSMVLWCKFDAVAIVDGWLVVRDAMAVDEIGYGTDWARAWPAIVGFCTFGVHTAQGSSPTKRSPHGLASGCVWELIFN